jgi:DNA-binding response OmpR family regulator
MAASTSFLLIEDDPSLGVQLRKSLEQEGYDVFLARTGDTGLTQARREAFALVILDWMLPDIQGIDVLRCLRKDAVRVPVLFLTVKGEIEDRVSGLNAGADDYLVKPFAYSEFLARIHTLLRRCRTTASNTLAIGDLHLNLVTREVSYAGRFIELTPREFELLAFLMDRRGETVSREVLVQNVWRQSGRFTSLDNVIDVHMANLRKKLRLAMGQDVVATVRGIGYCLQ